MHILFGVALSLFYDIIKQDFETASDPQTTSSWYESPKDMSNKDLGFINPNWNELLIQNIEQSRQT